MRTSTAAMSLVLALAATGCGGGLDQPTLVKTPRILAMLTDPPESLPGTDIRVGVIAHVPTDPDGLTTTYRWRLCASLPRILSAADIPADLPLPDTCETLPSTGPTATVPGDRTAALAMLLRSIPPSERFDTSFLTAILDTAGIPFEIEVDVLDADGEVLVTGVKIAAITTRTMPPPTTTPPVVVYSFGEQDVVMSDDLFDFRCAGTAGRVQAIAGEELTVTPIPGIDWTEEFPIYDYSGRIRTGRENEYYSFYATAGSISEETTRPPERAIQWTAPAEPGPVRFWMIVRDGHLGARGCWLDLDVVSPG